MTAVRSLTVAKAEGQSLMAATAMARKQGIMLWSSSLIYKTLSCRAIYLSALKSYGKTLSYTIVVPYSRVLSYIPIYSVQRPRHWTLKLMMALVLLREPPYPSGSKILRPLGTQLSNLLVRI
jgi:hypothetical protein